MTARFSVRALIIDRAGRILLCRHLLTGPSAISVWAAPGGGVETGESPVQALRRELREEVGFRVQSDPPVVWHQVIKSGDGPVEVVNDYFLIQVESFRPRPELSDVELRAEAIEDLRWWSIPDIANHRGPDLFSPRNLAEPLTALIRTGVPVEPVLLGL